MKCERGGHPVDATVSVADEQQTEAILFDIEVPQRPSGPPKVTPLRNLLAPYLPRGVDEARLVTHQWCRNKQRKRTQSLFAEPLGSWSTHRHRGRPQDGGCRPPSAVTQLLLAFVPSGCNRGNRSGDQLGRKMYLNPQRHKFVVRFELAQLRQIHCCVIPLVRAAVYRLWHAAC